MFTQRTISFIFLRFDWIDGSKDPASRPNKTFSSRSKRNPFRAFTYTALYARTGGGETSESEANVERLMQTFLVIINVYCDIERGMLLPDSDARFSAAVRKYTEKFHIPEEFWIFTAKWRNLFYSLKDEHM